MHQKPQEVSMKILNLRSTLVLSTITTFVVLAGMVKDYQQNNPQDFMKDQEITFIKRLDYTMKREVASNLKESLKDKNKIALVYLPLNEENASIINGAWKIFNRIDESDVSTELNKKVKLELIGNSKVIINDNQKTHYRISLLVEDLGIYRMALINVNNKGIEILELEKVEADNVKITLVDKIEANENVLAVDAPKQQFPDMELVLDKALNPDKSKDVMSDDKIEGHLSLRDGNLEQLSVVINKGTDKVETLEFDLAKINDGGQFEADLGDELVTGIISYNGDNALRVRIITGKLSGTMLNFLTEDQKEINNQQLSETEKTYEQEIAIESQTELENERKEAAAQTDAEIKENKAELENERKESAAQTDAENKTEQEVKQEKEVEKSGFEF
jgi:hypothetical protein